MSAALVVRWHACGFSEFPPARWASGHRSRSRGAFRLFRTLVRGSVRDRAAGPSFAQARTPTPGPPAVASVCRSDGKPERFRRNAGTIVVAKVDRHPTSTVTSSHGLCRLRSEALGPRLHRGATRAHAEVSSAPFYRARPELPRLVRRPPWYPPRRTDCSSAPIRPLSAGS